MQNLYEILCYIAQGWVWVALVWVFFYNKPLMCTRSFKPSLLMLINFLKITSFRNGKGLKLFKKEKSKPQTLDSFCFPPCEQLPCATSAASPWSTAFYSQVHDCLQVLLSTPFVLFFLFPFSF